VSQGSGETEATSHPHSEHGRRDIIHHAPHRPFLPHSLRHASGKQLPPSHIHSSRQAGPHSRIHSRRQARIYARTTSFSRSVILAEAAATAAASACLRASLQRRSDRST
jgi:hypothetical protein